MQKITPFLWFDTQAEAAAKFYTGIFKNSKMSAITRYGAGGPGPAGSVMTVKFKLLGQEFVGLNGGPHHKFTPAISFVINCDTQKEVDYYWKKLVAGGRPDQCGWLDDKFGVSWQIVPTILLELIGDKDQAKVARVMQAMIGMVKLDINALKRAAAKE